MTFAGWADGGAHARRCPRSRRRLTDETPPLVMRAKAHGAMLRIIDDRQAALAAWCRDAAGRPSSRARPTPRAVLAVWDGTSGPRRRARDRAGAVGARRRRWIPRRATRSRTSGRALRARTRDVVGEWAALLTDREALGAGFARHAPGLFSPGQLDDIHRWCVARDRLRTGGAPATTTTSRSRSTPRTTRCCCASTSASAAGSPTAARASLAYEHLMVDEVQDFSPLELAVLLDATIRAAVGDAGGRHRAGDRARARLLELDRAARLPRHRARARRAAARQLPVDARDRRRAPSTCWGRCMGDVRPVAPRAGAPVESFAFASAGECAEFLSHALKELVRNEPDASVALLARHPEQARALLRGARARRGAGAAPGRRPGLLVHAPASTSPTSASRRGSSSTS